MASYDKRPTSLKKLNQAIERLAFHSVSGFQTKAFRKNFIAGVLAQFLPTGSYLKGGAALGLRYPLKELRASRDIDSVFADSKEKFTEELSNNLVAGWEGFTGAVEFEARQRLPAGVGLIPLIVHLDYLGQRFATVSLEVSPDLGNHKEDAERIMSNDVRDLFASLGFDHVAPPLMMDIEAQLAEKLNGLSNPKYNRGKDLFDVSKILSHHVPDLNALRRQSRIAERRKGGHDTKALDESKKTLYLKTYSEVGGKNFDLDWELADELAMEVDLDHADTWHERWGDKDSPLVENGINIAERERRVTFAIRKSQGDILSTTTGKTPAFGDIIVGTYTRADGTVVKGYRRKR